MLIWCANKIIRYTVIVLLLCATESKGQLWNIGINAGIATYSYQELRDYQHYIQSQIKVEGTITEDFPAYFIYSININRQLNKWILEVEVGHGSTGGRVYYEDYSGKFSCDQIIKYNYLNFSSSRILLEKNGFMITGGIKTLFIFHKLTIENYLKIGNQVLSEEEDFSALNFGLQPYFKMKRNFKTTFIQVSCGYEVQSKSEPTSSDGLFLAGENGNPVHLQGGGFRVTVGVGFRI
ncbi:MAG: hypothetical protein JNM57_08795 [Cyclobacteriaceae bacterium]|nr:hypothetical protein [Cyclobacteriaceae bacterium]